MNLNARSDATGSLQRRWRLSWKTMKELGTLQVYSTDFGKNPSGLAERGSAGKHRPALGFWSVGCQAWRDLRPTQRCNSSLLRRRKAPSCPYLVSRRPRWASRSSIIHLLEASTKATMADPAQPRSAGFNTESTRTLLRVVILCLIAAAAIASRLFSVIRKSSLPVPALCREHRARFLLHGG